VSPSGAVVRHCPQVWIPADGVGQRMNAPYCSLRARLPSIASAAAWLPEADRRVCRLTVGRWEVGGLDRDGRQRARARRGSRDENHAAL
jgi:hypothetical protein